MFRSIYLSGGNKDDVKSMLLALNFLHFDVDLHFQAVLLKSSSF